MSSKNFENPILSVNSSFSYGSSSLQLITLILFHTTRFSSSVPLARLGNFLCLFQPFLYILPKGFHPPPYMKQFLQFYYNLCFSLIFTLPNASLFNIDIRENSFTFNFIVVAVVEIV